MTVKPVDLEEIFTGEEFYGKYLDLHQLHEQYVNLPHVHRIDYITYLTSFYKFKDIPMDTKLSPVGAFCSHEPQAYLEYLSALLDYLTDFYHRAQPLADVSALLEESRAAFAKKWAAGEIEGWNLRRAMEAEVEEAKRKREEAEAARRKAQSEHINDIDEDDEEAEAEEALPDFSTVESIERLGGERLKEMLRGLGAKCG